MGHIDTNALTYKHIDTHLGRESLVVFVGLSPRLSSPELMTIHCIEIDATRQGVEHQSMLQVNTPGDIGLLEGSGQLVVRGMVFGQEAKEQVGFPLSMLSVIPTEADGEKPHITGILEDMLRRNQCLPMLAITVYAPVISSRLGRITYYQCI